MHKLSLETTERLTTKDQELAAANNRIDELEKKIKSCEANCNVIFEELAGKVSRHGSQESVKSTGEAKAEAKAKE